MRQESVCRVEGCASERISIRLRSLDESGNYFLKISTNRRFDRLIGRYLIILERVRCSQIFNQSGIERFYF